MTEVTVTSFDEEGVMMRSSKDDRSWCESCLGWRLYKLQEGS